MIATKPVSAKWCHACESAEHIDLQDTVREVEPVPYLLLHKTLRHAARISADIMLRICNNPGMTCILSTLKCDEACWYAICVPAWCRMRTPNAHQMRQSVEDLVEESRDNRENRVRPAAGHLGMPATRQPLDLPSSPQATCNMYIRVELGYAGYVSNGGLQDTARFVGLSRAVLSMCGTV